MRLLWITNSCLPIIAECLNIKVGVFEGWNILPAQLIAQRKDVVFAVASPVPIHIDGFKKVECGKVIGYCFSMKSVSKQKKMIRIWKDIEEDFHPDIVHLQGTEMPHGMFYVDACGCKNVVASIQGLTSVYERYFYGGIDFLDIVKNISLYDLYSSNSIFAGRKRCQKSGENEIRNISRLNHIIGRTTWDMVHVKSINPNIEYHFCNETLRPGFYNANKWEYKKCERHTIFLSQCKYPIKALHMVLKAMPLVLRDYPDAKIYVGACLRIMPQKMIHKLVPTNYGGFLYKMIKRLKLEDHIVFLGSLNEKEMIQRFLSSNVFVSPASIENSPNSLCEAQLLGVPAVVSMVGGVEDLTNNGTTTFCYRFEEYEMLAYYICRIFAGDYECEQIQQAIEDAEKRHDPRNNVLELLNIYNKIINS